MKLSSLRTLLNPAEFFSIRGGVHPEGRKFLTADRPIERMPVPSMLRVPLQQHIGAPAEPLVERGDRVLKGQLIARARGAMSANVHAPSSGKIIAVGHFTAPHPSGLPTPTITMRPDGEDRWGERMPRLRPETCPPEEIAARVAEAGIVGMGGATFPAAIKLNLRDRFDLHTLVINAAECEPYLTCDDRLMREHAEEIADGAAIMARALGVERIIVAIESNKPEAAASLRLHDVAMGRKIEVRTVPTRYPMGSEKHLVLTLTGLETPARALTAELGIVVHNAATAHAVHKAVRYGEPLLSRVVTVSGRGIARPSNLEVLVGTPVADLIAHCGGLAGTPDRILLGGPMMGQPISNLRAPIVKGANGVLALSKAETRAKDAMPCIRCGSCVHVCPCGLTPFEMNARIQADDLEGAQAAGLLDCVSCGSCSWICPSSIRLVQGFNYAKGKLAEEEGRRHQREQTRKLAEARTAREAAIAEKKRAAMAKRKAEMAAKKAREAEEKAAAAPVAAVGAAQADPAGGAGPGARRALSQDRSTGDAASPAPNVAAQGASAPQVTAAAAAGDVGPAGGDGAYGTRLEGQAAEGAATPAPAVAAQTAGGPAGAAGVAVGARAAAGGGENAASDATADAATGAPRPGPAVAAPGKAPCGERSPAAAPASATRAPAPAAPAPAAAVAAARMEAGK